MNTDLPFKNISEALNFHVLSVERNNVLYVNVSSMNYKCL